ncbi:hypothetical protein HK101_007171 [Irineochytrium annulatum]|nr:hypothetical protein HK101_007171 [Irineochytrium annulatum]
MTIPSSAPVLELVNAFRRSKIMFTMVSTGIVDFLHENGPANPEEIASHLGRAGSTSYSPVAVDRVMRASVALGLVALSGASPALISSKFELTPLSKTYLATSSPNSLSGYIIHSDKLVLPLFDHMTESLKTGKPCWSAAFPDLPPSQSVFSFLYATRESKLQFMNAMHSHACLAAPNVAEAFDLSWVKKRIADLGAGTGALATQMARRWKQVPEVFAVDLPEVVEMTEAEFLTKETDADIKRRVKAVAGDIFEAQYTDEAPMQGAVDDPLPRADVYCLSRILHDWDDKKCLSLLQRIHRLLPNTLQTDMDFTGALIIGEGVLKEDRTGPLDITLQDMNMLVQTGGRERTFGEYKAMLELVGFSADRILLQRTGTYLDAIIAYKTINFLQT